MIELLVVIAILAILASLLLPTLSKGKAAAVTTECRNNLHTLGLAMRMYVDECDHYPLTVGSGLLGFDWPAISSDPLTPSWTRELRR